MRTAELRRRGLALCVVFMLLASFPNAVLAHDSFPLGGTAAGGSPNAGSLRHSLGPGPVPEVQIGAGDGYAQFQAVVGTDDRIQLTPTTSFPLSALAFLDIVDARGGGWCTGAIIGPQTVLTAAHCVYDNDTGAWAYGITVVPGRDGRVAPFGYQDASDVIIPPEWAAGNDLWDWALVKMPDSQLSDRIGGWLRIGWLQTDTLQDPNFEPMVAGYPGDRPEGTLWGGMQEAFTAIDPGSLYYQIDTSPGESGAPVVGLSNGMIVGIHVGGNASANVATRIGPDFLAEYITACEKLGVAPLFYAEPLSYAPIVSTWARTDKPVADVSVSRTWMWGPQSSTGSIAERYVDAPGGYRTVEYFDKSRMEITDPSQDPNSLWYVTNGLLAKELITGRMQLGNDTFVTLSPAQVNIAGDQNDPNGPTYASFNHLLSNAPIPLGWEITQTVDRAGNASNDSSLADYGVTASVFVPETNHNVASVFWDFMNSSGLVYQGGGFTEDKLFLNPFYATGYPITEAYWTIVKVGGVSKRVLVQVFERRVLTYTPDNPDGWRVEAGNVGQHYYKWRYGG